MYYWEFKNFVLRKLICKQAIYPCFRFLSELLTVYAVGIHYFNIDWYILQFLC